MPAGGARRLRRRRGPDRRRFPFGAEHDEQWAGQCQPTGRPL